MAQAFRRLNNDTISGALGKNERIMLRSFFEDTIALLEPGPAVAEDPLVAMTGVDMTVSHPDDPALLRLLPDAVVDDEEAALEFRRLNERSLRTVKLE